MTRRIRRVGKAKRAHASVAGIRVGTARPAPLPTLRSLMVRNEEQS